jgi:ADP-heptose:LPS heptosyltransferase
MRNKHFNRILIYRNDKIGDAVLSLPAFRMLRNMYPASEIKIVIKRNTSDIFKYNVVADGFIFGDDRGSEEELAEACRSFAPDLFIALYHSRTAEKIALSLENCFTFGHSHPPVLLKYDKRVLQIRRHSRTSETTHMLNMIRKLDKKLFDAQEPPTSFYNFGGLPSPVSGDYFVFHPFTGGTASEWKTEETALLIKTVSDICGIKAVISSPPDKADMANSIAGVTGAVVTVTTDINELASLINSAKLFIGTSSAPLHIANSLKKPAVGIYNSFRNIDGRFGAFDNPLFRYIVLKSSVKTNIEKDLKAIIDSGTGKDLSGIIKKLF